MKRFLLVVALLLVLFFAGWALFAMNFVYSDGYRVGTLIKITNKGYFIKTWEGQLNLGGFSNESSDKFSTVWDFSVLNKDDEVIQQINDAVERETRVKLFYNEMPYQFSWRGDTKYFVYKVEELTKSDP